MDTRSAGRVHRPDADLRRTAPSIGPRPVRRPLQPAPAAPVPPAATTRPRRSGQRSAGLAGSAAESARRCDQRVLPGSVADLVNPQVTRHATGFEAVQALLRTSRRSLQMVLRLLAHNAEHWLSRHLNAYLCDDDEYRAITRETTIRGLAGRHHLGPHCVMAQQRGYIQAEPEFLDFVEPGGQ